MPCVFGECRFVNDDEIGNSTNDSREMSQRPVARGPTGLKLKQICECKSAAGSVFEYDKHCALVLPPEKCPCENNGICKPLKPTRSFLDSKYGKSKNVIEFNYLSSYPMTIRFKCFCAHGHGYNIIVGNDISQNINAFNEF